MAIKPTPITAEQVQDAAQAVHVDESRDENMAAQANAIEQSANVDSITDIIKAIGAEMNTEKAKLAVSLLNVTSYAVSLQGRSAWNTRDFMSFGVALAALSQIDKGADERDAFAPRGVNLATLERTIAGR